MSAAISTYAAPPPAAFTATRSIPVLTPSDDIFPAPLGLEPVLYPASVVVPSHHRHNWHSHAHASSFSQQQLQTQHQQQQRHQRQQRQYQSSQSHNIHQFAVPTTELAPTYDLRRHRSDNSNINYTFGAQQLANSIPSLTSAFPISIPHLSQQQPQQYPQLHNAQHSVSNEYSLSENRHLLEAYEDIVSSVEPDEYGAEIIEFMRNMETATLPNPAYMERQNEINWKLRKVLVLWLVEVHAEYDLRPETLYLAVNFVDRVCTRRRIGRRQYQLLGISALWIAAKYEENHGKVPTLKNLIYICCNSFTERDFVAMEQIILGELEFILGHPTAEAFLKKQCHYCPDVPAESRAIARYIMELMLIHRRFLSYRPSTVSAASLILASSVYGQSHWSSFSDPLLNRCVRDLEECLQSPPPQMVNKYSHPRFLNASHIIQLYVEQRFGGIYTVDHNHQLLTPPKESNF